ncbi:hypothetical protein V1508DRAFT_83625 [Lipomyces doorenjongii]|uniref:uncharacterized protein n=1 Tax=Lipomyces doorenjongii TaxID=383834 RepID=UPI0034CFAB3B
MTKMQQQQQEDGSWETCTCSAWHRYLLPCSSDPAGRSYFRHGHSSSLVVYLDFPPVNVSFQHIDPAIILGLNDPVAALPRKGPPKGTRRLQSSNVSRGCSKDHRPYQESQAIDGSCKMPGHNRRKCPKLLGNVITTENKVAEKEQDQGR